MEQEADATWLGTHAEYSHLTLVLPRGYILWLLSFDIFECRFLISDSRNPCVGLFVKFGGTCGHE